MFSMTYKNDLNANDNDMRQKFSTDFGSQAIKIHLDTTHTHKQTSTSATMHRYSYTDWIECRRLCPFNSYNHSKPSMIRQTTFVSI